MKSLRIALLLALALAFAALTGCSSDDGNVATPTLAPTVQATVPANTVPANTAPSVESTPGMQGTDPASDGLLTTEAPTAVATTPTGL